MRADVVIVGAGTAGAAAAAACARAGLRTICLEQRALKEAGARWVNGVPAWTFREAGFDLPVGEELRGSGHAFHIVSGWGPKRIVLRDHEVCEVDMRHLVARLQNAARGAGAELVSGARVTGFDGRRVTTSAGDFEARWFVDASGLSGARLLEQPRTAKTDLCSAAQEVRAVSDRARARAFFEDNGAAPGDTLCFTGVAGGFSVVNVRLDDEGLSVLTGSIPAEGFPSGPRLLQEFVDQHAFVGARIFGGARAIPLRRPFDRLGHGNVLLLGDSACQVFSAHGSGIGAGLLGARVLADTLAAGGDAHAYSAAWHRRYGALFASYDAFRRFSQRLSGDDVERLMSSGLLDEWGARAGLAQRLPELDRTAVPRLLRATGSLARHRDLARRLAPALARMALARPLYASYPSDPADLPAWSRRAARLLGGEREATPRLART
jgi:flavin-dependent dehydrogenase